MDGNDFSDCRSPEGLYIYIIRSEYMNTEQINSGEKSQSKKYTAANSLINYYLAIMFTFFPLFLTDQYAHARICSLIAALKAEGWGYAEASRSARRDV